VKRTLSGRRHRGWRAWLLLAFTVLVALLVVFAAYSYSETYRVEVKDYTFSSPDVPEAFDGARIVLVTDVHRAFFFSQSRLENIVAKVNGLDPDLVALGGDYVYGSKGYETQTFAALGRLKAPLGVYGVLGNHDYAHPPGGGNDPTAAMEAAAKVGIPILDNKGVWVEKSGQRFRLAGVSDLSQGAPVAAYAVEGTTPSDLVVLMSHEPDFAEYMWPGDADLVLSGHTHGGQITFFGLWAPRYGSRFGYLSGVYSNKQKNATVIVSNGVGTVFPPLRFFARPQIVVVTLRRTAR
jgi:predicted MPP superfamily phosphohydrolase